MSDKHSNFQQPITFINYRKLSCNFPRDVRDPWNSFIFSNMKNIDGYTVNYTRGHSTMALKIFVWRSRKTPDTHWPGR